MPITDLISTSEASKLLNVSSSTLRRWTDEGNLTSLLTPGGHRRWSRASVLAYAYRQQQQVSGDEGMTVVEVTTYPAVWKGNLIVSTDGERVWHEIKYAKDRLSGIRVEEALSQGETWKWEPELQVYFDERSHNCIAQYWFSSTGARKADVEADIVSKLPQYVESLKQLTAQQGISAYQTPEGRVITAGEGL